MSDWSHEGVTEMVNTRNVIAIRDYSIATREMVRAAGERMDRVEAAVGTLNGSLQNLAAQVAALRAQILNGGPTDGNQR